MRRPERFGETLREEIAEIVGFELDDPRLESVTVTDVKVAADSRDARVYVLIGGGEAEINAALAGLKHAATFVHQRLAANLNVRHVPHLHFVRDTAEENAARVGEILADLDIPEEGTTED
ncbi:MAG: ribosome-binding factor A [Acidobacteria bacterium OLB17]|nr:MAG: ribosome-binding factor A [Acidobacteria bacterium OLB17]MCZ2389727.1 30S ribosome-binding factor RbfA [Acidobacteriota bacterium]